MPPKGGDKSAQFWSAIISQKQDTIRWGFNYGGITPFVEGATTDSRFRYFPMPAMPQMLDLTITNPSIPANSTLNVNFSAEKKN